MHRWLVKVQPPLPVPSSLFSCFCTRKSCLLNVMLVWCYTRFCYLPLCSTWPSSLSVLSFQGSTLLRYYHLCAFLGSDEVWVFYIVVVHGCAGLGTNIFAFLCRYYSCFFYFLPFHCCFWVFVLFISLFASAFSFHRSFLLVYLFGCFVISSSLFLF